MTFAQRFPFITLMRMHQWLKNLLVGAGIFFAHQWGNETLLVKVTLLFFAFSFTSSGIYVINDYFDRHADQLHPRKYRRPIASRLIDPRIAILKAHGLLALGWVLAWYTGHVAALFAVMFFTVMNLAYSRWLKHIPILDVSILAGSYLIRIVAGTECLNIPISSWLFLCGLTVAMLMGFGKRLAEKQLLNQNQQRKSVQFYSEAYLQTAITVSASLFLVFYGLYTLNDHSLELYGRKLIFTYPLVIIGVLRYLYMVGDQNPLAEDPATLVLRDRALQIIVLSWISVFALVMVWSL